MPTNRSTVNEFRDHPGRFSKAIVALVGLVIGAVGRRYGVDSQVYTDLVAAGTFLGVFAIPNK